MAEDVDEMIEFALRMLGGDTQEPWYARIFLRQSDRVQLATLATVIAIYKELRA